VFEISKIYITSGMEQTATNEEAILQEGLIEALWGIQDTFHASGIIDIEEDSGAHEDGHWTPEVLPILGNLLQNA